MTYTFGCRRGNFVFIVGKTGFILLKVIFEWMLRKRDNERRNTISSLGEGFCILMVNQSEGLISFEF